MYSAHWFLWQPRRCKSRDHASDQRGLWGWEWRNIPEDGANEISNNRGKQEKFWQCRPGSHRSRVDDCRTDDLLNGADGHHENLCASADFLDDNAQRPLKKKWIRGCPVVYDVVEQVLSDLLCREVIGKISDRQKRIISTLEMPLITYVEIHCPQMLLCHQLLRSFNKRPGEPSLHSTSPRIWQGSWRHTYWTQTWKIGIRRRYHHPAVQLQNPAVCSRIEMRTLKATGVMQSIGSTPAAVIDSAEERKIACRHQAHIPNRSMELCSSSDSSFHLNDSCSWMTP